MNTPHKGTAVSRFLRLHAFEILIFVIMFILLALCLAAAPLISKDSSEGGAADAGESKLVI